MSSPTIRLVCFDLGRVLVRICDNWAHASEVANIPKRVNYPLDPQVRELVNKAVFAHEVGKLDHEPMIRELAQYLGIDVEHVDAIWTAYVIDAYPGGIELIDDIHAAGYKTACLSNINPNHWDQVRKGGKAAVPIEHLNYQFASHLIGHRKPDAGAYEHVERETGFHGPEIVFFDDIEENIEAARKLGWIAEVIARDHQPVRQVRNHLIRLGVLKNKSR